MQTKKKRQFILQTKNKVKYKIRELLELKVKKKKKNVINVPYTYWCPLQMC